jgi:hypothetical protein
MAIFIWISVICLICSFCLICWNWTTNQHSHWLLAGRRCRALGGARRVLCDTASKHIRDSSIFLAKGTTHSLAGGWSGRSVILI